ncbi:MAG: efflux RND transporter periplasmic adaptor subunit [Sutterella sp.]
MQLKLFCLTAFTAAALLLSGCGGETKKAKTAKGPLPVETVTLAAADEPVDLIIPGTAEGFHEVTVRAETDGRLLERVFEEGGFVREGDVLFRLERDQPEAKVRLANARLAEARSDRDQAARELDRAHRLWKSGAGSRRDYDDRRTELDVAEAALKAAEAVLAEAQIALGHTVIYAPVAGFIGRSSVNPGDLVSAHSTALAVITQRDRLRIQFAPPAESLRGFTVTAANAVSYVDKTGKAWPSPLDFVSPSVDKETGTIPMRSLLTGEAGVLPGTIVRMTLTAGTIPNAIRLPQKAVRQNPDGTYTVFIAEKGKAAARSVTLSRQVGTDWLALSGVKAGDRLIVNQILKLKNGIPVEPRNADKKKTGTQAKSE